MMKASLYWLLSVNLFLPAVKDRTANGTFVSVASVRRSPTALLRFSGG